jgi:hypothetical protein
MPDKVRRQSGFFIEILLEREDAEHAVKGIAGVSKDMIHAHEEKAETFALISYLLGLLSLISLWASWKKKSFSALLSYGVMACILVTLVMAQQTGNSGGEIRHTEIRSNFTPDQTGTATQNSDENIGDKDVD